MQVYVGPFQGTQFIRFGDPANPAAPGITINCVAFGAQNVPGTLAFLQLANNMKTATDAQTGKPYHWSLNGQFVLDVGPNNAWVFYQNAFEPLAPNANGQFDITDSPALELDADLFILESIGEGEGGPVVPETYQTYLMFCPASPNAIYVPIAMLSWSWEGYSQFEDGAWSPVQQPGNSVDPVGTATTNFPTWNGNTNGGQWVPGLGDNVEIRRKRLGKSKTNRAPSRAPARGTRPKPQAQRRKKAKRR